MTEYRSIDPAAEKLFEVTLQRFAGQLEMKKLDTGTGLRLLAKFDDLKKYKGLYLHKVTELKGKSGSVVLMLLEKLQTIVVQRRNGRHEQEVEEMEPVLVFSLPHDMGRAFIRRESMADKLTDLITQIDIDFEQYPQFSRNYHVVGEQPELVRKFMPTRLMEALERAEDITVEINGNWALLRTEKNLSEEVLLLLIESSYKMTK
ncbi:MAG: hypothetical protein K1X47_16660 [Cyclobacteriaceae bacterium]|nr:hypothetical protein [Cyclobacteriaceae bacterium]